MHNTPEHFDPASEGFVLVLESLEAAGVRREPGGADIARVDARDDMEQGRGCSGM